MEEAALHRAASFGGKPLSRAYSLKYSEISYRSQYQKNRFFGIMERKTHTMLTQLPPASRPPVIVRSSILSKAMRQLLLLATTVVLVLSLIAFVMVRSLVLHRMLAETSSVAAATEGLR